MRKLDVFNHFFPEAYYRRMLEIAPSHKDMGKRIRNIPLLHDLDGRFRVMDGFGDGYQQILSLPTPPITRPSSRRCSRSGGRSAGPTKPASRWRASSSPACSTNIPT